jgi:hypothetical protein
MKKTFVLFLGLLLVLSVAATADMNNWQIKCGVTDNVYPFGNDFGTRFGVDSTGTFAFDTRDSVHPSIGDPFSDLGFIYKPYQSCYTTSPGGFTWASNGWLKQGGVQVDTTHGPGLPSVGWPSTGLIKDTRAPMAVGVPEFWKVTVQAPQEGDSIKFVWSVGQEAGLEIPMDGTMYVKILSNPDLVAAGIVGDLDLLANGAGTFETRLFPQFGLIYNEDGEATGPVQHTWIIEAGRSIVPEPGTYVMMAGVLLGIGGMIRRRK